MQEMEVAQRNEPTQHILDPSIEDGLQDVRWGRQDELLSAAYWKWRCDVGAAEGHNYVSQSSTLREEVGFCLLGGFGIKMELNNAFFSHLKSKGVFEDRGIPEEAIRFLLEQRIDVRGREQKYRFPKQKAHRIAVAMDILDVDALSSMTDFEFRHAINAIPGSGAENRKLDHAQLAWCQHCGHTRCSCTPSRQVSWHLRARFPASQGLLQIGETIFGLCRINRCQAICIGRCDVVRYAYLWFPSGQLATFELICQ